jgi:HEAT repeats
MNPEHDEFFRPDEADQRPDPETLARVKDILILFAHTISAMKLFPSHHASVASFQDELYTKIQKFLADHWELELRIDENAFRYKGEIVYQDENIIKSLPYVFFKDGLYELAFLRDMDKEEFTAILDTIKDVALLPAEDGDIVEALWEKDIVHLRYFAPDEFLESKLTAKRKDRLTPHVDPARLFQGKIELRADDLEDISKRMIVYRQREHKEAKDFIGLSAFLDKGDLTAIETMLTSERGAEAETSLSEVIFELLYMENRLEAFKLILAYLDKRWDEMLQKADFSGALRMADQMTELSQALSDKSPARTVEIDKFIRSVRSRVSFDALRDQVRRAAITDSGPFFEFLRWVGPETLPVGAEILENDLEPGLRSNAFDFLVDMGKENLPLLARLVQERKPFLSKTIIAVFERMNDKSVVPFLAPFLNSRNRDVKMEAVRVLGGFPDPIAQKILIQFLRDADEEIRTAAAERVRLGADKNLISSVAGWAAEKYFHDMTPQEKQIALSALGRIAEEKSWALFRSILGQKGIMGKSKTEETALLAVTALETLASPPAIRLLREGEKSSGRKKVKEACMEALGRLTSGPRKT